MLVGDRAWHEITLKLDATIETCMSADFLWFPAGVGGSSARDSGNPTRRTKVHVRKQRQVSSSLPVRGSESEHTSIEHLIAKVQLEPTRPYWTFLERLLLLRCFNDIRFESFLIRKPHSITLGCDGGKKVSHCYYHIAGGGVSKVNGRRTGR